MTTPDPLRAESAVAELIEDYAAWGQSDRGLTDRARSEHADLRAVAEAAAEFEEAGAAYTNMSDDQAWHRLNAARKAIRAALARWRERRGG